MLKGFLGDRRGSVLPTFAIVAVPLLLATGGVVDYTNAYQERTIIQNALDAGILAAGKKIGLMTDDELQTEANNFYLSNIGSKISHPPALNTSVAVATITGSTELHVPTYFLGIMGLNEIIFNVKSTVTLAMGTLEVAMALDNSGSMTGTKISTLITAANDLTDRLFSLGSTSTKPDPVKVAVIPFAGSVNVGASNRTSGWMDTTGVNPYHGENFELASGSPPVSTNSPAVNVFSLFDSMSGSNGWAGCVEERPAPYDVQDDEATIDTPETMFVPMFAPDEPDNWTCSTSNGCSKTCNSSVTGSSCTSSSAGLRYNGAVAGNFDYNNYLPDAGTASTCGTTFTVTKGSPGVFTSANHGLVAGQQVTFSTTGSLYSGLTAGTNYYVISSGLTTNSFKVSTSSGGSAVNTTGSQSGTHSFMTNAAWTCKNGNANCGNGSSGQSEQTALLGRNVTNKNLCKYGTSSNKVTPAAVIVDISGYGDDYAGGPNFLCTTPALEPLTTVKATAKAKISSMVASGTTNITAGLMWGWRALSPTEPFSEGRAYTINDNQKILILMTDGQNTYEGNGKFDVSQYGAWGYVWKSHLGTTSTNENDVQDKMDSRMALACTKIKAAGVKIYTIGFQISDQTTLNLLQACATSPSMAFQSSSTTALIAAFSAIGDQISLLRVAQ